MELFESGREHLRLYRGEDDEPLPQSVEAPSPGALSRMEDFPNACPTYLSGRVYRRDSKRCTHDHRREHFSNRIRGTNETWACQ